MELKMKWFVFVLALYIFSLVNAKPEGKTMCFNSNIREIRWSWLWRYVVKTMEMSFFKWEYTYWIKLITLGQKGKMFILIFFSFCHIVFKSSTYWKGLTAVRYMTQSAVKITKQYNLGTELKFLEKEKALFEHSSRAQVYSVSYFNLPNTKVYVLKSPWKTVIIVYI